MTDTLRETTYASVTDLPTAAQAEEPTQISQPAAPSPVDAAIDALKAAEAAVAAAASASGQPVPQAARAKFDMNRPRLIEPVPIQLDRVRHLTLPLWACMEFEELTGINPWDNETIFKWPPDMKMLTTLLWVGLKEEDPKLTLEDVRRLPGLEFGQIYYVLHCLDLLWGTNMPDPDPVTPGQQGPGRADPNPFAAAPTT